MGGRAAGAPASARLPPRRQPRQRGAGDVHSALEVGGGRRGRPHLQALRLLDDRAVDLWVAVTHADRHDARKGLRRTGGGCMSGRSSGMWRYVEVGVAGAGALKAGTRAPAGSDEQPQHSGI